MKKNFIEKSMQKGSLMIEALAMLGLIGMVTPVVYKKAAERTTEIQDINEAGYLRMVSKGLDEYLTDRYTDASTDTATEKMVVMEQAEIEDLIKYLPEGAGADLALSSKLYGDISVQYHIKPQEVDPLDTAKIISPKVLTGFVIAKPRTGQADAARAARIASMIGANGGYVRQDTATPGAGNYVAGSQGVWKLDIADVSESVENPADPTAPPTLIEPPIGSVVTASMHSITDGGGDVEGVLYRVERDLDGDSNPDLEFNTMETNLYLGDDFASGNDIRNVGAYIGNTMQIGENLADGITSLNDGEMSIENLLTAGSANVVGNLTAAGNALSVTTAIPGSGGGAGTPAAVAIAAATNITGAVTIDGETTINDDVVIDENGIMRVGDEMSSVSNPTDIRGTELNDLLGDVDGSLRVSGAGIDATQLDANLVRAAEVVTDEFGANDLYGGRYENDGSDASGLPNGVDPTAQNYFFQATHNLVSVNKGKFIVSENNKFVLIGGGFDASENIVASDDSSIKINTDTADITAPYFQTTSTHTTDSSGNASVSGQEFNIGKNNGEARLTVNDANITANPTTSFDVNIGRTPPDPAITGDTGSAISKFAVTDGVTRTTNIFNVIDPDGDNHKILQVGGDYISGETNLTNESTPSIYIRGGTQGTETGKISTPGQITLANREYYVAVPTNFDTSSYVGVDKIVTSVGYVDPVSSRDDAYYPGGDPKNDVPYDRYMVDPAFTSVMNDIKLASRGGARLSDILPDYINKGIYQLTNTFDEQKIDVMIANTELGEFMKLSPISFETLGESDLVGRINASCEDNSDCITSPWMGFVPAPACPPGYSRIATISPTRANIAKAYGVNASGATADDRLFPVLSIDNSQPLQFQGSTWLNTSLQANTAVSDVGIGSSLGGDTFVGWHALMGFLYSAGLYQDYLGGGASLSWDSVNNVCKQGGSIVTSLTTEAACNAVQQSKTDQWTEVLNACGAAGVTDTNECIIWNMLPVYNQEMAAIVTTYCHFDRNKFDTGGKVDTGYNQLTDFREVGEKDGSDLNDPQLDYNDVW